ncbi:hypothetical protein CW304_25795 [Bacillus sp. UFRGS-B20]|nr:hypothetical protein CW304_25795 [Bacillus sp. UFRGS-B20]
MFDIMNFGIVSILSEVLLFRLVTKNSKGDILRADKPLFFALYLCYKIVARTLYFHSALKQILPLKHKIDVLLAPLTKKYPFYIYFIIPFYVFNMLQLHYRCGSKFICSLTSYKKDAKLYSFK